MELKSVKVFWTLDIHITILFKRSQLCSYGTYLQNYRIEHKFITHGPKLVLMHFNLNK